MDDMMKKYLKSEMMEEKEEDFQPYPAGSNDKPFMTYDKLQTGAFGKPAPKQGK